MKIRRALSRWAITAALVAAATLGVTAGAAQAATRNPCTDLANQRRANENMMNWNNTMGRAWLRGGFTAQAVDAFERAEGYLIAMEENESDAQALGC